MKMFILPILKFPDYPRSSLTTATTIVTIVISRRRKCVYNSRVRLSRFGIDWLYSGLFDARYKVCCTKFVENSVNDIGRLVDLVEAKLIYFAVGFIIDASALEHKSSRSARQWSGSKTRRTRQDLSAKRSSSRYRARTRRRWWSLPMISLSFAACFSKVVAAGQEASSPERLAADARRRDADHHETPRALSIILRIVPTTVSQSTEDSRNCIFVYSKFSSQ